VTSLQSVEHFYLDSCLAPIASYLALPNLTDLFINRPGELWIETIGSPPRRVEAPDLTSSVLNRLARQIAAVSAQGISRENPLLSASLPTGERVQIVLPPATRGDIAFAFRKHVMTDLGLDDYHAAGAFDASVIGRKTQEMYAEENGAPIESGLDVVRRAVRTKRNILISGGTSSGKTTYLNALLREAAPHERLIAIEDTPELRLVHDNAVGLITPRGVMGETHVTAEDLLIASLRMRPDRILLGEIRGKEAMTFLRAINTGHPGSMATIHADSPARAIDQLAILVMQQGTKMSWEDVTTYVKRSIGLVVHLTYDMGVRRIDEIAFIS
jgi:type IV secretion system protein VirB11